MKQMDANRIAVSLWRTDSEGEAVGLHGYTTRLGAYSQAATVARCSPHPTGNALISTGSVNSVDCRPWGCPVLC